MRCPPRGLSIEVPDFHSGHGFTRNAAAGTSVSCHALCAFPARGQAHPPPAVCTGQSRRPRRSTSRLNPYPSPASHAVLSSALLLHLCLICMIPINTRTTRAMIIAPRRPSKNQPIRNATTEPSPTRDHCTVIAMLPTSQRTHNRRKDEAHDCRGNPHDDRNNECLGPAHAVETAEGQQPNEPTD